MIYCSVDVETTGLKIGSAEVLTLGAVVFNSFYEVLFEKEYRFRPVAKEQWSVGAEKVHGISWKESQSFPTKKESLNQICSDLENKMNFVCHARPNESVYKIFDYGHIFNLFLYEDKQNNFYNMFPEDSVHTTILPSKKEAKELWGVENQKLGTWGDKLGIEFDHHNAIADARMGMEVFKYQRENIEMFK